MKALRLSEVLLPLLAARSGAPWLTAPRSPGRWPAPQPSVVGAARALSSGDRTPVRTLFDDVQ